MDKLITNKIEKLRQELYDLYAIEGDMTSEKILTKSQELDKYILIKQANIRN